MKVRHVVAGIVTAPVLLLLAAGPASANGVVDSTSCEAISGITGEVLTAGPAAACYSTTFGESCVAYTHNGSTTTCYVPF
jgi:hypothetical protein